MNLSYWEKDSFFNNIDIAIIGSGIVGLCAAIELKERFPTKKIVVFERSFLPSGASTKNAGFACFGSISEILKDFNQFAENEVYSLIERRWKGLAKLRNLCGDANLGYEPVGGYELFLSKAEFENCADNLAVINKQCASIVGEYVYKVENDKIDKFGFDKITNIIFNKYEGLVNTGLMMKTLLLKARNVGVEIINGLQINSVVNQDSKVALAIGNDKYVFAQKVLIATNAFAKDLLPNLNLKPGRGQVLVTKPIKNLRFEGGFHIEAGYYYFRNIDNRILIGGGRNLDFKAEETTTFGSTQIVQDKLQSLLKTIILPKAEYQIDYSWSGIMAFGDSQAPIIEPVCNNIVCAVKCQGMGVALGALVGEEASAIIANSF
jgi:gamma-glutamylputrescine oxidase